MELEPGASLWVSQPGILCCPSGINLMTTPGQVTWATPGTVSLAAFALSWNRRVLHRVPDVLLSCCFSLQRFAASRIAYWGREGCVALLCDW